MSTQTEIPVVKLLLLGEASVGKTSLLLRFTEDKFKLENIPTIGIDFKLKIVEIDETKIKVQVWDTSGQEKFRNIAKSYYRGAHGILVVFDVSRRDTFNLIQYWIDSIKELSTNKVDVFLVGNKIDLERSVTQEEASNYAKRYDIPYYETSAKETTNVDKVFLELSKTVYNRIKVSPQTQPKGVNIDDKNNEKDYSGCLC